MLELLGAADAWHEAHERRRDSQLHSDFLFWDRVMDEITATTGYRSFAELATISGN